MAAEFHDILGYEVVGTLGFGARSTIYAVRDSDGQIYAMKRVVKSSPSDERYLDQAISEHEVASQFDHDLLRRSIKLFKQRQVIRVSEVYVLMEMIDGVTLEQHQPKSMAGMIKVCGQVAQGMAVMHKQGYIHADMKPNNVMVSRKGEVKIIDFGQSCKAGTVKERIQGTPDYIAPEQVKRRPITVETDVFNLGATMYWLLTKTHVPTLIPKGKAGVTLRTEIRTSTPAELNDQVPPALSSLVMDCIEKDPVDRPRTMDEVVDRLEIAAAQVARRESNGGEIAKQKAG